MSNNPKFHQLKKAQEAIEQNKLQHEALIKYITDTFLNKLCLVGVEGGISSTFVTDIKTGPTPAIAVALSTDKKAGEGGKYFDFRALNFYHVYDEVNTARIVAEFEGRKVV